MSKRFGVSKIIFVCFSSLGLAACGGGGGTSGTTVVTSQPCTSSEDACQIGISIHNATTLNSAGYTGSGVKVAVVDSGIDASHPEFDGKTITGYDFASSSSGYGNDENGHGTHVASIIAGDNDNSGMQGIAYNASIYDYKADNDGDGALEATATDASTAAIYNRHVTDNINVSNNSWGSGYRIDQLSEATIRSWDSNTITALRAAQNNGTLFVFSAGNGGTLTTQTTQPSYTGAMPYRITELADEWLLVVAVDKNLQETEWTQRCGYAWSFCVAAVGGSYGRTATAIANDGIYGAKTNTNGYTRSSGTSQAAPQVSGIAALLMEKFPSLTPAQIATRIKSTASMSGLYTKYGNLVTGFSTSYQRTVFGNGLVNASSAAAMIGTPTYPLGENYYEGVAELSGDLLSLPSWISGSAASKVLNSSFTVFDSFDGARFDVTGSTVFTASNSPTSSETVAEFIRKTSGKSEADSVQMINLSDISKISFFQPNKLGPAKDYWGAKASLFSTNDAFKPNTSLGMRFVSDTKTGHAVSFVEVGEDSQDFVAGTQLTYISDGSGTSILAGLDMTNNKISTALLSTETDELKTYGVHFGLQQRVGNNWSVFLKGSQRDLSDVAHSENKWGFQNAKLNHYAAGLEYDHGSTNFVVGVQEPEEIASGTLNFTAPAGRHRDGQIIWQDRSFSFGGQNHRPLFTSFGTDVGKGGKVKMSLSEDHYHSGKLGDVKLGYSLQF